MPEHSGTPKIRYPNPHVSFIPLSHFPVVGRIIGPVSAFKCYLAGVEDAWGTPIVVRPPSAERSWLAVFVNVPNGMYALVVENGERARAVNIEVRNSYGTIAHPVGGPHCGAEMTPYGTYVNQITEATIDGVAPNEPIYQSNNFWCATWTALADGSHTVRILEPNASPVTRDFTTNSSACD